MHETRQDVGAAAPGRSVDEIHFLKDLEVRDLDTLDLASLAHSLHQGVHLASLPFRIALFGPWGSGKTTIMRRVQALLDEATEADRPPHFGPVAPESPPPSPGEGVEAPYVRTLYFNPWEYESETLLMNSLVRMIAAQVPDGVRYSRKGTRVVGDALDAVRALGPQLRGPGGTTAGSRGAEVSGAGHLDELSEPDRLYALRQALRRLVDLALSPARRGQSRRLVVFVDDLDKCLPESVLSFLEGCKLFFTEQARIVFVFALDKQVLSSAISLKYSRGAGFEPERYIEKIFEFSYTVHPIEWHQLGTLVGDLYARSRLGQLRGGEEAAEELRVIEDVLQRPGVVSNPRRIKRTFNRFIWFLAARQWLPNGTTIGLRQWLSWLLVSEYWPEFRGYVARFGEEVLGELVNRVTGNLLFPHANEVVRQSLETLAGYRSLLEYFRSFLNHVGDFHASETQAELRRMIGSYVAIDRTLRAHGL